MINTLINETLICLDLKATRKQQVFDEMAELLLNAGNISDKAQFIADVEAREAIANTGFEEGIALPHAKSAAVRQPAVAIGISRAGIDYGAEDGLPSHLFFMIASPEKGGRPPYRGAGGVLQQVYRGGLQPAPAGGANPR